MQDYLFRRQCNIIVYQIIPLGFGKFIYVRHFDAFRRAGPYAERAIATFGNINVEFRYPEDFFPAIACNAEIFARDHFCSLDVDAIHGTCARALVATDTIVHVDVQSVADAVRKLVPNAWILARYFFCEQMAERNAHPDEHRPDARPCAAEIFAC